MLDGEGIVRELAWAFAEISKGAEPAFLNGKPVEFRVPCDAPKGTLVVRVQLERERRPLEIVRG